MDSEMAKNLDAQQSLKGLKFDQERLFGDLVSEVIACTKCERMCGSQRILSKSSGEMDAPIMFVGEAPGRLGADSSGIPFHGDKAGNNFESFLDQVGISRYSIFVTNAVLCNPRNSAGNNASPNKKEIFNCSEFLHRQIKIVNPSLIVTLGSVALEALRFIESHTLCLKENVRTQNSWFGRALIPLYHPGQRALIHRSFANQLSDYQFVAETFKRFGKVRPKRHYGATSDVVAEIVRLIFQRKSRMTYFALHKLFYLIECESAKRTGERLTGAFFVRQKNGPYCTELHISKLRTRIPELQIFTRDKILHLELADVGNLDLFARGRHQLSAYAEGIVDDVIGRYGELGDARLKTIVYLTSPMRSLLRMEKSMNANFFNSPLAIE